MPHLVNATRNRPRPTLGLSGHAFRGWAPEELLEVATRRWGIKQLDYWPWNRGELTLSEYGSLLEQHEVEVSVVNVPSESGRLCDPVSADAGCSALLAAIDEAVELKAPAVQFYTGVPLRPDAVTCVKLLSGQLAPAVEKADRAGITLLIENNLDQRDEDPQALNPSRLPELLLAVCEASGAARLKICFDPCNFYTVGVEAFPYAYDLLREHIGNVHIKDCRRYSALLHRGAPNSDHLLVDSHGGSFLPVPVGEGAVNWHAILPRLRGDSYGGWLTLDPFSAPEPLVEWCDRSLTFLANQLFLGNEPVPAVSATAGNRELG